MFALTAIKGVGRRYSNIVLKKADIDLTKRAGELTEEEVSRYILAWIQNIVNLSSVGNRLLATGIITNDFFLFIFTRV